MAFNGSGTYTPPGASFPAVAGTTITAAKFNNIINDMSTALSTCITKDGQTTVTADIPFGGNQLTDVGTGLASRTMAATTGDAQDGTATYVDAGGTGDAITATFVPVITAVVDGMMLRVRATAANTGAATFSPNGLTARAIVKGTASTALAAGDIIGDGYEMLLTYRSADTTWQLLNPNPATNGPAFLTYDTTNKRLGINNTSPSVPLHVKTNSPDVAVAQLQTTAANGSGVNTTLMLRGDSLATSGDGHRLAFTFGGGNNTRAAVQGVLTAATVGNLVILTSSGSTAVTRATVATGMYMAGATGGDQGAGTINATGLFVNGVAVSTTSPEGVKVRGYVTYSGGVPTLVDSLNVTSITDAGTGELTVTIATDFGDADYALTALSQGASGNIRLAVEIAETRTAGAFGIRTFNGSAVAVDPDAVSFAAFGDQ